jgi:hypothetical protein
MVHVSARMIVMPLYLLTGSIVQAGGSGMLIKQSIGRGEPQVL